MSWADQLPQMQAELAEWRTRVAPRLRARDERQRLERARFAQIVRAGCGALAIDAADAALVFRLSGVSVTVDDAA